LLNEALCTVDAAVRDMHFDPLKVRACVRVVVGRVGSGLGLTC
jgi:hypothetical protein